MLGDAVGQVIGSTSWWRRATALLASAALVGACGTTASLRAQAGLSGNGNATAGISGASGQSGVGNSAGVAGAGGSGTGGTDSSGSGSSVTGGATGSNAGNSASGAGSLGTGPAGSGSGASGIGSSAVTAASGKGFNARDIYFGVSTEEDLHQYMGNIGISFNPGSIQADIRALARWVNSHGGVLGRQLVPVFHDNSTASLNSNPTSDAQANCVAFTQDNQVVAVLNPVAPIDIDSFRQCMQRSHTPLFSIGYSTYDDATYQQFGPYLWSTEMPTVNPFVPSYVTALANEGYFGGWNTSDSKPSSTPPMVGILETGLGLAATEVVSAHGVLARFAGRFLDVLADFDVVLTPTASAAPVPVGWFSAAGPEAELDRMLPWSCYTPWVNLAGCPAVSLPLHRGEDGLPYGTQLVGRPRADAELLALAGQLERAKPWQGVHPPMWKA